MIDIIIIAMNWVIFSKTSCVKSHKLLGVCSSWVSRYAPLKGISAIWPFLSFPLFSGSHEPKNSFCHVLLAMPKVWRSYELKLVKLWTKVNIFRLIISGIFVSIMKKWTQNFILKTLASKYIFKVRLSLAFKKGLMQLFHKRHNIHMSLRSTNNSNIPC